MTSLELRLSRDSTVPLAKTVNLFHLCPFMCDYTSVQVPVEARGGALILYPSLPYATVPGFHCWLMTLYREVVLML